ncbi:hypothetical protein HN51_032856 [Arachis hypogaea]|uniref:Uncharacterized protein LOC107471215 n=1 Tax=Arachis duranensis TaxID=130453 RepID=A0A6P4C758_ARADU|nr:uncharacterized protein LOC107471215 [Arachis duranensis]XP_025624161.1 uncharacterized protein LOC112716462 [Arachis hypogaea]QHO17248.1 uncharacterized protein DS421_10g310540 [Arachis hypogaea]
MMDKESEELALTPEVTKPDTVETRRFSSGKGSSGNNTAKVVPRYLRASTGSCHDFCKYGRRHELEGIERRSIPDRATRKQLYQSSQKSIGGIMTSVAKLRGSLDSRLPFVKLQESIDSEHDISDTAGTNKHGLSTKSFDKEKQIGNDARENWKKTSLVKFKPSLLKSHTSPSAIQEISTTAKEVKSSLKSTSLKLETSPKSASKKVEAPSNLSSKKVKAQSKSISNNGETPSRSNSKVKTSSRSTSNLVGTSSEASSLKGNKDMKLSEKRVTSLSLDSATRNTISTMKSSKSFGSKMNSEIKMEKDAASSKTASRKLIAPIRTPVSPRPSLVRVASLNSRKNKSLKIVSRLKNQQNARKVAPEESNNNDNQVEEKTLYVIKMESGNKTLESDQNPSYDNEPSLPQMSPPNPSPPSTSESVSQEDQEESDYTTSEFEMDSFSSNHELENMENRETLEVEEKGKPTKGGIVCSDDVAQVLKLKFRRGKVVDNQLERNTPRRLKFRRAKLLGEKANLKGGRKSLKGLDEGFADGADATTGPEKVVLRHQDMQDKKDAQGLFNNVIEETASKLVEARKSKVKALVGAFETVISLQEKKPPANTVS